MDENYLDNLLNEFSLDKEIDHKIEDELDEQIQQEKRRYQDNHELSKDLEFDLELDRESAGVDVSLDLHFSEEQMEELDELDELADLDIGNFDFSDIDFEDVDMTNLDQIVDEGIDDLLKDFEGDLEINDFFHEDSVSSDSNVEQDNSINQNDSSAENIQSELDTSDNQEDTMNQVSSDNEMEEAPKEELNEDNFDANVFLDSLLEESEEQEASAQPFEELLDDTVANSESDGTTDNDSTELNVNPSDNASEEMQSLDDLGDFEQVLEEAQNPLEVDNKSELEQESLDDLLSLLDMESTEQASVPLQEMDNDGASIENLDTADGVDLTKAETTSNDSPKKKRTLMEILFGDDDDDDELSEEELAAIAAKKAEKKEKKEAAKAAKKEKSENAKAKKAQDNDIKKKNAEEKKRVKAERKRQRLAEEMANAEPEKKLNKAAVVFIFTFFLGSLLVFTIVSNDFNYTQVIKKATSFFANQKYRRAYNEIVGVEVKEKDQNLKDRIYTVMYVERLYESYNNNMALGYEEKALDSLLRGVDKYFEHYEEAADLGILSDLNYSFEQIKQVLENQYGITIEDAQDINKLDNIDYIKTINNYVMKHSGSLVEETMDDENAEINKDENNEDETK